MRVGQDLFGPCYAQNSCAGACKQTDPGRNKDILVCAGNRTLDPPPCTVSVVTARLPGCFFFSLEEYTDLTTKVVTNSATRSSIFGLGSENLRLISKHSPMSCGPSPPTSVFSPIRPIHWGGGKEGSVSVSTFSVLLQKMRFKWQNSLFLSFAAPRCRLPARAVHHGPCRGVHMRTQGRFRRGPHRSCTLFPNRRGF